MGWAHASGSGLTGPAVVRFRWSTDFAFHSLIIVCYNGSASTFKEWFSVREGSIRPWPSLVWVVDGWVWVGKLC